MALHLRAAETPPGPAWYPRAWAVWAAGVLTTFAALEAAALAAEPGSGRTLTAQLRRARRMSGAGIALFAAWLFWHVVLCGCETPSPKEDR